MRDSLTYSLTLGHLHVTHTTTLVHAWSHNHTYSNSLTRSLTHILTLSFVPHPYPNSIACMESQINTLCMPCGHLVLCSNCAPKVNNKCKRHITRTMLFATHAYHNALTKHTSLSTTHTHTIKILLSPYTLTPHHTHNKHSHPPHPSSHHTHSHYTPTGPICAVRVQKFLRVFTKWHVICGMHTKWHTHRQRHTWYGKKEEEKKAWYIFIFWTLQQSSSVVRSPISMRPNHPSTKWVEVNKLFFFYVSKNVKEKFEKSFTPAWEFVISAKICIFTNSSSSEHLFRTTFRLLLEFNSFGFLHSSQWVILNLQIYLSHSQVLCMDWTCFGMASKVRLHLSISLIVSPSSFSHTFLHIAICCTTPSPHFPIPFFLLPSFLMLCVFNI